MIVATEGVAAMMERAYTVRQVADLLQVSEETIRREARAGRLASFYIGGGTRDRRFRESAVEAYIEGRRDGHAADVIPLPKRKSETR